ncbi:MAG: putative glycoside hydrolase [Oscillospiraceae bacterium]
MPKQRKIVRTKNLYKIKKPKKKLVGTIMFIFVLLLLVALGFIVSKEWAKRFGKDAPVSSHQSVKPPVNSSTKTETSSGVSSSESSNPNTPQIVDVKATAIPYEIINSTNQKTFLEKAKTDGYNSIYIPIKNNDGIVLFNTTNEMAKKYGAISPKPFDLAKLIADIKTAGLKPVAQISALKDNKAAHTRNENSYAFGTTTNVNWLDDAFANGGKAWLNPYMDNTRKYIGDITGEVATAGVEAIVLENVMFPDKNVSQINKLNKNKPEAEILSQLVTEAQTAAKTVPVYYGFNAVSVVIHSDYKATFADVKTENIAPQIDLANIRKNKNAIIKKLYPDNKEAINKTELEITKDLINFATKDMTKKVFPVLINNDFETLKPILNELKIGDYAINK